MKRVRLGSAAISSVQYDDKAKTLDIEFREGETYRYEHVPKFVYRALLKAESVGAFWNGVKDNYKFIRLEKDNRRGIEG
jgi:hypothetical protein